MSAVELEAVRDAAFSLSEHERARLVCDLVASLDGPSDKGAAQAWDIEICRRINEIEKGDAALLDLDEVMLKVKARLGN